jgi:hypothetical protein
MPLSPSFGRVDRAASFICSKIEESGAAVKRYHNVEQVLARCYSNIDTLVFRMLALSL